MPVSLLDHGRHFDGGDQSRVYDSEAGRTSRLDGPNNSRLLHATRSYVTAGSANRQPPVAKIPIATAVMTSIAHKRPLTDTRCWREVASSINAKQTVGFARQFRVIHFRSGNLDIMSKPFNPSCTECCSGRGPRISGHGRARRRPGRSVPPSEHLRELRPQPPRLPAARPDCRRTWPPD